MMMEEATASTSGSSEGILVVVERPLVVEDLVVPLVRVQSGGGGGERDDASELVTRGDEDSENRVAAEVSPWGVLVHEVDEGQPCLTCKDKCPGFSPHLWRKVCNNCKCPRESHDVYHEEFVNVRDRIGIKPDPSNQTSKEKTLQEGYSWVPPGLSSAKIEEYFSQLPNHKVPRLGTPGEKYRDRQLIVQLPKQDLALAYCKFLERECQRSFEDFVNARNEIALDIGYVREALEKTQECFKCGGVLPSGELAVIAPKFGELVAWHPACFVCAACQELLVDLTYCAKDGHLYCERHYAETLKPRCSACDEVGLHWNNSSTAAKSAKTNTSEITRPFFYVT